MTCSLCHKDFIKKHPNQKLCSDKCRVESRKANRNFYKKTAKGLAARKRWQSSEKFKANEKILRLKPKAKALAIQRGKKYKATPNGKIVELNAIHRRRMGMKTGYVTAKEWCEKLAKFNYCCAYCGTEENIQMDHIHPLSKGGLHHIDNIQPLCGTCNASKGAKVYG